MNKSLLIIITVCTACVCDDGNLKSCASSYVFVGLWDGLHQVHPLSVDLDERQDVSVPDGLVKNLQPGRSVSTAPLGEALLRVLRRDVVLPHLPGNQQPTITF